ncbi:DUF2628 domain-containing protein [Pseudodesulfovibrio tunisiensis]|uniref:DUF2628 domain-containing protein n=1 Tax=Pseudodesulfovibrio tunisiensis TaxID=463192 RepID=UPI001FB4C8D4|nr:DUF2628 domain-containing protein [Pseudodesulfovibrio tunisiensis]
MDSNVLIILVMVGLFVLCVVVAKLINVPTAEVSVEAKQPQQEPEKGVQALYQQDEVKSDSKIGKQIVAATKQQQTERADSSSMRTGISVEDYEAFVGNNFIKYYERIELFDSLDGKYKGKWHWPGFFFAPAWLLYRKLYPQAAFVLVLSFIPIVGFIAHCYVGWAGYHMYYKNARKSIESICRLFPNKDNKLRLKKIGGTLVWVPWLSGVLYLLGLLAFLANF